jgi:hypothetical protein
LSGQQQQQQPAVIGPGSPLFQSWNPASVIPASSGHHPPPYLDMAALANLRQLYEQQQQQQQQQQHPGSGRPNFFPPHHPGSAFSPANFPPPPQPPPGQSAMAGNSHSPAGMIRPDQQSSLAAQQWWLLAQARQHQQRLFAAAAVASHRFPPGNKRNQTNFFQNVITGGLVQMGPSGFLFPQQVASNGPNQKKKKTNKQKDGTKMGQQLTGETNSVEGR